MEPLITSDEVAAILRVDVVTIRRLVNRKELPAYRIGSEFRFSREDLEEYLRRQRTVEHSRKEGTFMEVISQVLQKRFSSGTDRFDRFTARARHAVKHAQEEAYNLQHAFVGTEHLLLGLLREEEGVAIKVLRNLSVEPEQVRARVIAIVERGENSGKDGGHLTHRARKTIELSVEEAQRMRCNYVGTEHLLLGLMREGEGIAAGVLKEVGLSLDQLREEVARVLKTSLTQPGMLKEGSSKKSNLFKHFGDEACHIMIYAQEEAQRCQHNYIGTEHLLLGMLREEGSAACIALGNLGIKLDEMREKILTIVSRGDHVVSGELPLTPRSKLVISLAVDEARRVEADDLSSQHLLLGMIREGEGVAAGVLEERLGSLERVRAEILHILEGLTRSPIPQEAASLLAEREEGLTCIACGARSPRYFLYCFNCGKRLPEA